MNDHPRPASLATPSPSPRSRALRRLPSRRRRRQQRHPNVFLAALGLTGFVVAYQVRRIWALSSYCEHRPSA